VILLLNLGVLVVNFFLAFKTNDLQIGLMRTASESVGVRVLGGARITEVALPYTRVLQSLESVAPGQDATLFTPERLQAIYEAIRRYRSAVERGVTDLVYAREGQDLRSACADLDKAARQEVEIALATRFGDAAVVQRLATEIIRSCR
jgi:hypothetical protein